METLPRRVGDGAEAEEEPLRIAAVEIAPEARSKLWAAFQARRCANHRRTSVRCG